MKLAKRMDNFGESIFSSLAGIKNKRIAEGKPVYDFSVGTPNVPPAQHIIDTLVREAANPKNYVYALNDLPELQDAVAMASLTPAQILGIDDRYGSIAVGKRADLCILNAQLEVQKTIIDGATAYEKGHNNGENH